MPLYFAYGSNMDRAAMAQRCPASKVVGVARLMRHHFFISSDGYASVARDPRRVVWGVLWDLAFSDIPALDRYEGVSTGLYTKIDQPVLSHQGPRRSIIYLGRTVKPGAPKPGYMEDVVSAAREAGLPQDYLQSLEVWLPHATAAATSVPQPAQSRVRPIWGAPTSTLGRPKGG